MRIFKTVFTFLRELFESINFLDIIPFTQQIYKRNLSFKLGLEPKIEIPISNKYIKMNDLESLEKRFLVKEKKSRETLSGRETFS